MITNGFPWREIEGEEDHGKGKQVAFPMLSSLLYNSTVCEFLCSYEIGPCDAGYYPTAWTAPLPAAASVAQCSTADFSLGLLVNWLQRNA